MSDYRDSHKALETSNNYEIRYSKGAEAFYWSRFESIILKKIALKYYKTDRAYLDFASGTGRIAQLLNIGQQHTTLIDISEAMLSHARKKLPKARIIRTDITTQSTVQLECFQFVTCFRFLLNAQPELRHKALKWIRNHIDSDGLLIINNHGNKNSLFGLTTVLGNVFFNKSLNTLTHQRCKEILFDHGFDIVETHHFRVLPTLKGKLLLPKKLSLHVEEFLSSGSLVKKFSKDTIYVCRPIPISSSGDI